MKVGDKIIVDGYAHATILRRSEFRAYEWVVAFYYHPEDPYGARKLAGKVAHISKKVEFSSEVVE